MIDNPEALFRLIVALLLGALIGAERQWHQRTAGLRTNALVAVGAAAYTLFSELVIGSGQFVDNSPTRVAAQVVSGIGFLGAGVIMKEGANVRGITTAATIWVSAAVGVFAGAGFYIESLVTTIIVLLTNILLRPVIKMINRSPMGEGESESRYLVHIVCDMIAETKVRALLLQDISLGQMSLRQIESRRVEEAEERVEVLAELATTGRHDEWLDQIVGRLSLQSKKIHSVRWRFVPATE